MKGDFTRLGFDPAQAFTRVLMQQGRVQLDSDWNEKQEIDLHAARGALRDLVSLLGVPAGSSGFAVQLSDAFNDLTIGTGRLYCAGVACENDTAGVTLSSQPYLRLAAGSGPGLIWPQNTSRYLVYLDVWERDIDALIQPSIRETALGGPDTATRTRLIWQVRLEATTYDKGTEDFPAGWVPSDFAHLPVGTMLASTAPPSATAGACVLPPQASYTSLSNQLYRVEIHTSGSLATDGSGTPPTFKWSRDNASVVTNVLSVAGQVLTVADLGPDDVLSFQPGQVVELIDEGMDLSGQAGALLLVDSIDVQNVAVTIAAATPVPAVDLTGPVLLRRWDQPGVSAASVQGITLAAGPLALESGIQVNFQPGFYRAGDHWTFPARTAIDAETGNIVWPAPAGTYLPAQGAPHRYVPLALVDYIVPDPTLVPAPVPPMGRFILVEDCRAVFSPATGRLAPLRARWANNGQLAPLQAGQSLRLDVFGQGVMLATGVPLDASSVSASSVQLLAELPVSMSQILPGSTDSRAVGSQVVVLASTISLATSNKIVIAPGQAAYDLLSATLARRLTGGSQEDFPHLFTTSDFGAASATNAVWQIQTNGDIAQTNASAAGGASGSSAPVQPSLALSTTAINAPISHAGVSFSAGPTPGQAGIVFNWTSNSDFWIFYNTFFWQVVGFSGAFPLMTCNVQHIVNGAITASFVSNQAGPAENSAGSILAWTADLDIATSATGLTFLGVARWANNTTSTFSITAATNPTATGYPTSFTTGSRVGLMARGKGDLVFTRLQWTDSADSTVDVLPVGGTGPVLVRLIAKPSLLRTAGEAAIAATSGLPLSPPPEPDFETSFLVTPAATGYYGSGSGDSGAGAPGIGSDRL